MSSPLKCKFRTIELPGLPAIELSFVKGGMGVFGSEHKSALPWEKPAHKALMSDFWIMRHPVSQSLYRAVMLDNPSRFISAQRPVENVRWKDAIKFAGRLNNLFAKKQGIGWDNCFGLPTEHQWEYASRSGIYSAGNDKESYSGSDDLSEVGWYHENGFDCTMTSGLKRPNQLGLYDMSGNAWEWCADTWNEQVYYGLIAKQSKDPVSTIESGLKNYRGGCWRDHAWGCRAAYRSGGQRDAQSDILGFRLIFSRFAVDT